WGPGQGARDQNAAEFAGGEGLHVSPGEVIDLHEFHPTLRDLFLPGCDAGVEVVGLGEAGQDGVPDLLIPLDLEVALLQFGGDERELFVESNRTFLKLIVE